MKKMETDLPAKRHWGKLPFFIQLLTPAHPDLSGRRWGLHSTILPWKLVPTGKVLAAKKQTRQSREGEARAHVCVFQTIELSFKLYLGPITEERKSPNSYATGFRKNLYERLLSKLAE